MSFRRIRAVARKEFRHIMRDPRSLSLALAMPMMMLLLFGYALTLDVDQIPTVIYDQDRTPQSRDLLERSSRHHGISKLVDFPEQVQEIEQQHSARQGGARYCDPARLFAAARQRQNRSSPAPAGRQRFQYRIHRSGLCGWSFAGLCARTSEALHQPASGVTMPKAVEPRLRVWYNISLKSKNYVIPGLIAVILMIISAMLTSLTIAREWEMGTMEQLLSTPLRPAELVLGKMSAYFALGLADALIAVGIGVFLFGVPMRRNLAVLFVSTCHLSVWRPLLGCSDFGHRPIAAPGLPDGNHQLIPAGVSAFRFYLLDRKHAGSSPGCDPNFPGTVFRHSVKGHLPERHWSNSALGRAWISPGLLQPSFCGCH